MAAIDVSGWTADHPLWTFENGNASYALTPGDNSSRLSSGKLPFGASRTISFYATVGGGHGIVYLRGYTADDLPLITISRGGTGVLGVSYTFDARFTRYELILGAFPNRDNSTPEHDVIDPNQVIGFSSIGVTGTAPAGGMPGQVVTGENGEVVERGARTSTAKPSIPQSQHALVRGDKIDKNWYQYLQSLPDSIPTVAEVQSQAAAAVAAIPDPEITLSGMDGIRTWGGDNNFFISLKTLEDSGVGDAIWRFSRDTYGRVSGTQSATTDHLPEGVTNLYFTDERAQDATGAAITAGTGDGVTLTYDDAGNAINAANTDKGSVAVAAHEALADPHPQYLTPAEGDAAYAPLSHVGTGGAAHADVVAGGASGFMTGADKTKLDGVATGATAYTDAMARAAAVADSITDDVTTIAPSQNAVFDALALKTTHADLFSDFVVSGLLSPTSANLTSTIAAGTAYVTGLRVVKAAEAFTYAASSDTYEDLASTGVITRVAVANGAAAPAITANNLRLQKVVTDATAVTAVTRLAVLVPSTMLRDRANHTGTQLAATVSDFTSAARAAAVADAIADAVTDVAPSQNAVFDALALKTTNTAAAITGGTINGATIGATTPSTGSFTTVTSSGNGTFNGVKVSKGGGDVSTNVALGSGTLNANTTGSNNVALGVNALSANTTGSNNTAIGTAALSKSNGGANVAIGLAAILENTTGSENAAIGVDALRNNTTGSRNVGIGYWALKNMDSGVDSVAIGYGALSTNTTGPGNLALGFEAGRGNTTGGNNVMLGFQAGHTDTAANANVSGNINVWIGYWAGPGTATQLNYSTAIGGKARVTTSNTVVLGRTTDNTVLGATGDDGSGAKLQVTGAIKATGHYKVGANQVVGARDTGWAAMTGTATKTAIDTSTATTQQLAERVKALTDALIAHGIIGA